MLITGGKVAYPVGEEGFTDASCESAMVTVRYLGFHRVQHGTGEILDTVDLWLPDVQFETQAVYIRVPPSARLECIKCNLSFREGLHAASHAVLNVLSLFVMCNVKDMATEVSSSQLFFVKEPSLHVPLKSQPEGSMQNTDCATQRYY